MPVYQSPGVYVTEVDLTQSPTVSGTTIGAYADNFNWGPVNEIVTISNENELISNFGRPDNNTSISFFTAANFLAYTNQLKIVRASDLSVVKNATTNSDVTITISNQLDFEQTGLSEETRQNAGPFVAKYPGSVGNTIKYSICDSQDFSSWQYASLFTDAPGTSDHVFLRGGANDEIHVVVVDEQGYFTGTPGSILEKYSNLSRSSSAKDGSGNSIYYRTVINESSKYIRSIADPIRPRPLANVTFNTGAYSNAGNVYLSFSGGGIVYLEANAQVLINSSTNAITQIVVNNEGLYSRPPQVASLIAPDSSVSATFNVNLYPQFVSTTPSFGVNGGINWDVRDFSFVRSFSVLGTGSIYGTSVAFRGIEWHPDGSQFYLIEDTGNSLRHFKVSEPWNADSKTQVEYATLNSQGIPILSPINLTANNLNGVNANFNISSTFNLNPVGFEFGDGGRKFYVLDLASDYVFQYDMEIPYNLPELSCKSNAFLNVVPSINSTFGFGGLTLKPDGTQLYIVVGAPDYIFQYTMSTPWQINTASFVRSSFLRSTPNTSADLIMSAAKFAANGSLLIVLDDQGTGVDDKIYMYKLTEAWNVATVVLPPISNLTISSADTNSGVLPDMFISPNEDRLFVLNDTQDNLREYTIAIGNPNYTKNSTTNYYTTKPFTITLKGGVDAAPKEANVTTAYSYFNNSEEVDVGLVLTGDHSVNIKNALITSLIETRKDCILFVSPKKTDVLNGDGREASLIAETRAQITNSSYVVMDSGWKYQYDKHNDTYRWIPLNADIAGVCAKTSYEYEDWFSPGGLKRGLIKNIEKLAYNPKIADRDYLYDKQINPVVYFQNNGFVLYGDKTLSRRTGAFDRINIRRLSIFIKKALSDISRYYLFELNDSVTRRQLVNVLEPFLRNIQGKRGIVDFRLVCDETNNTGEVIDDNQLVVDIYVKPNKSINYIQLNFIASRTSVILNEFVPT